MTLRFNWCLPIFVICMVASSFGCVQSTRLRIYIFAESSDIGTLLPHFSESDYEVIFYSLNESSYERFFNILETLMIFGVKVIPPDLCISCGLQDLTWTELLMLYATPLLGFFFDEKIIAITLGINGSDVLYQAITASDNDVKVFTVDKTYSLNDEGVRIELENLFLEEFDTEITTSNLVSSIALLAISDSVNPCTFSVFTALLFLALHSFGKTKAAQTGLAFIMSIFLCYYILGSGLIHVLAAFSNLGKALALVGLVVGAFSIMRGLKPSFESPLPKSLKKFMELQIRKSYVSPIASFVLGVAASFTLLPCSSGPYIVSLSLLSALKDPIQTHLLLALYNTLFVTPLIGVLLAILASNTYTQKIKAFRSTRLGIMELISGSLLTVVCAYQLLS